VGALAILSGHHDDIQVDQRTNCIDSRRNPAAQFANRACGAPFEMNADTLDAQCGKPGLGSGA
jgi:hypothetical protein